VGILFLKSVTGGNELIRILFEEVNGLLVIRGSDPSISRSRWMVKEGLMFENCG
jgi:hypothetical protein